MHQRPFTALAAVYDAIMADVEYDHWADFVLTYARDGGLEVRSALDLACGTGGFTLELWRAGLWVHGVDGSPEMLEVARERLPAEVTLSVGDLRTFELGETFDLVTCVFDSLNNLLTSAGLGLALGRMRAHLRPGGLLACDLNTRLGVRELWEENAIEGLAQTEDGREVHYHWSHQYDAQADVGVVQAFCRVEDGAGGWEEFTEEHRERGYDPADLEPLLTAAGFARWEIVEYPDYAPPSADTPRVWVFAWA
ncbi:class I SAM-dependent methyltransferase [Deinococcus metallilatus]|uniref:SAM-dependent methyltransferase n=1 Tax=Deinococcus metallilatus TaxID=1211322 RepID=A0AAJ5JZ49_9DEIO|nr:class I SAM-dependent methyltransferase [Deinococcus metallilatus]MBB5296209.1 SAM-dependent methyltransferase [Deinococcus metallilatus]QBY09744.1 class I SAM-dependent methyltransferase [Deinococcus metallilatus]RXJ08942.1 class I SAM-dependent methyltransferase [Deinococcus metallilatus]TLK23679.1 class I SAM-dependent methyltransferase [Deinococcus metallilatus]GMA14075.1 methyltransferase type 11 [Deinococcus metallilatus]